MADPDVALRLQMEDSIGAGHVRDGAVAIDVVPALWANRNKAEIVQIPERSSRQWRSTCITRQAWPEEVSTNATVTSVAASAF